jgi:hypothetical protein
MKRIRKKVNFDKDEVLLKSDVHTIDLKVTDFYF